jgi:hypothetical protein
MKVDRAELLKFCQWLEKDEFGEGHEEEIVDKYLAEQQTPVEPTVSDYPPDNGALQ